MFTTKVQPLSPLPVLQYFVEVLAVDTWHQPDGQQEHEWASASEYNDSQRIIHILQYSLHIDVNLFHKSFPFNRRIDMPLILCEAAGEACGPSKEADGRL